MELNHQHPQETSGEEAENRWEDYAAALGETEEAEAPSGRGRGDMEHGFTEHTPHPTHPRADTDIRPGKPQMPNEAGLLQARE